MGQPLRVGEHQANLSGVFRAAKTVAHRQGDSPDNEKAVLQNQVVDVCHRAGGGILHGNHAEIRFPLFHSGKHLAEGGKKRIYPWGKIVWAALWVKAPATPGQATFTP